MSKSEPIHILCMEDNVAAARLLQKRLERAGYMVDVAHDGEEGLAMYAAGSYDVVAVDQNMPVRDGLEVIHILASRGPLPPTIMITGAGDEKTAVEAMKLGAGDYIVKDVDGGYLELLPSVVERVLHQQRLVEEKQQAEEALKESEEKYRALVERANDGIVIAQGNFIKFVNSRFTEMLGYEIEELTGVEFTKLLPPENLDQIMDRYKRRLAGEDVPSIYEITLLKKNGEEIPVEVNAGVIQYKGKPANMSFIRDITERKRAEEALRQSEERFALAVRGSNDGIWDWDIQNNSLYWSARLKELLAYADDELDVDFETFDSHLHPDDKERTEAAIEAHLKDRELFDVEQRLRTKSGEYRWFRARGQALWDGAGNPLRMTGSTTDITERKQAEEHLQRRNLELAALNALAQALASSLELQDLLDEALSRIVHTLGFAGGLISLADKRTGDLAVSSYTGLPLSLVEHLETQGLSGTLCDSVYQEGKSLGLEDLREGTPVHVRGLLNEGLQSYVGAPIVHKDRTLGTLCLFDTVPRPVSETDYALLTAIGQQIGVAVENARLFAETQKSAQQMEALYETSRALSSYLEEEPLMRAILEVVYRPLGCEHVLISTVDQEAGTIGVRHGIWRGEFDVFPKWIQASQYPLDHPDILTDVYRTGRTEIIGTWDDRFNREIWDKFGHERFLRIFMPIKMRDRVIGVVEVGYDKREKDHISEDEVHMLAAFMDQAAVAIQKARLFEETQRRVRELLLLHDMSLAAASGVHLEKTLQAAAEAVAAEWEGAYVALGLLDPESGTLRLETSFGYSPDAVKGLRIPVGEGITGWVAQHGEPLLVPDVRLDPRYIEVDRDIRSELCVPLVAGSQVIGVLNVESPQPDAFTDDDQQLLSTLGSNLAVLIERKRAEEALRDEKALMDALMDNITDSIYFKDRQCRLVRISRKMMRDLNLDEMSQAVGKTDVDLFGEEFGRKTLADDQRVMATGEPITGLVESRQLEDGQINWTLTTKVPLRDASGQIVGLVGITHDINELIRAEEESRKAKEAAEAADHAKSEFLANMSHEIRTPLNAVIGMTGLLLDTELSAEQQDYAETIRSSGEALLSLINDILDFSKIEAGKLELETQPFDLRDCVEESLDLVAPKAAEKGLELAYIIAGQPPSTIVGDVTRLRQVLVNLLSNAVKFTEKGEVVVSIARRLLEDDRHELHFAVRDTGIGIPKERMGRLFQSFSQVDASTTRKYGGTGLGLTISKRLAEMMGGTTWVESEVGKGSTFHFTILAEAAPPRKRVYLRAPELELVGKRVLIVDDNATNRRILTKQVQSWGMLPCAAASGPEALEWIGRGAPFDVAILDMHMPEMDGLTLAAEIRKHRAPQALPLVMLTSLGRMVEAPPEVSFAAYLTKPIKPSQLYDVLVGIFTGQPIQVREPVARPQLDPQMGQRHPLRILLAEDNVVNQKVALRILERLGYRADVAANGLEVLEALERQSYDVVLMDVQMPEMDGVEATYHIVGQWPEERRPHIIAMTAHAMQGDRERYLAVGMDDYISKPVRVEELVEALGKCQPLTPRTDASPPVPETAPQATAARSSAAEAIDAAVLEKFRAMMGEVASELVGLFLGDTPKLLADLREAVAQGDAEGLEQAAHTLKSSSATLGAMTLSALCQDLEVMGRAGALEGTAEKVTEVEAEYERVKAALEEQMASTE